MGEHKTSKQMGKKAAPINIAVHISDPHLGSEVGLWPPGYKTKMGARITQNDYQKWLWKEWIKAVDKVNKYVGDRNCMVILNGDIVDGIHHRTTEVNTAKKSDQIAAAIDLIRNYFPRFTKLAIVRGTPCHVEDNEGIIGAEVGAIFNKEEGDNSFYTYRAKFHGCLLEAKHHMSCGTRTWTEAGAMSALMNNARSSYVRAGKPVPKVFLRAHRHRKGIYSDGDGMVNVNGAWQGLTSYGHKVVPEAVCQPSITILDWNDVDYGELPIAVMIGAKAKPEHIDVF